MDSIKHLRVLLADDHETLREGVRVMVEQQPGWEVCGHASTGSEAITLAVSLKPDIIVMDIGMPAPDGLDATRQIKRLLPEVEVLIFTAIETEKVVREVFNTGARGYLLKTEAGEHLIPAIEMLASHRTYFSSKVSEVIFSGYLNGRMGIEDTALTLREREIVQLIAAGKTTREMTLLLGIGIKKVETHRATVMRKLRVDSIAGLVRYAVRNGIVEA